MMIIIMPNSSFKLFWNIVIMIMLAYTSIFVPYQIAFQDDEGAFLAGLSILIDVLFFVDIIVNFFSSYETTGGREETSLKKIARNYIGSWFLVDLLATFPTQILEKEEDASNSDVNKLARLARLPRLYRLLRIMRIFKIIKVFKYNRWINKMFTKLKLNAGMTRMLQTLCVALFMVHLFSCFWFLSAKFSEFNPNTWVYQWGILDSGGIYQYSVCLYWAFQTLTTVGYGDFGANTIYEYFINLIWMLFGVSFYSFVVGSLTSIITAESSNADNLNVSHPTIPINHFTVLIHVL